MATSHLKGFWAQAVLLAAMEAPSMPLTSPGALLRSMSVWLPRSVVMANWPLPLGPASVMERGLSSSDSR